MNNNKKKKKKSYVYITKAPILRRHNAIQKGYQHTNKTTIRTYASGPHPALALFHPPHNVSISTKPKSASKSRIPYKEEDKINHPRTTIKERQEKKKRKAKPSSQCSHIYISASTLLSAHVHHLTLSSASSLRRPSPNPSVSSLPALYKSLQDRHLHLLTSAEAGAGPIPTYLHMSYPQAVVQ